VFAVVLAAAAASGPPDLPVPARPLLFGAAALVAGLAGHVFAVAAALRHSPGGAGQPTEKRGSRRICPSTTTHVAERHRAAQ
jgi:hypothetical protein